MNNPYKFNKEKEKEIIELYLSGKTQKEIADYFKTFNTSIRRVLIRNKIKIRNNSEIQRYVKVNPFTDNEISDYFLGLLLSDGCISNNTITLSLKEEDLYMLNMYASFLSSKVNVNKYFHTKHQQYQYEVKFKNSEVIKYLQSKANFINKSFDLKIYTNLNWNIFRGVLDGDGGFTLLNKGKNIKMFICGKSQVFINQLFDFLVKEGFTPTITKDNRNLYYVNLHKKQELHKLYGKLYQDADVFLSRKHLKLATFLAKSKIKNDLNSGKEASSNPERNL